MTRVDRDTAFDPSRSIRCFHSVYHNVDVLTHSIRSESSQWKHFVKSNSPNIEANGTSNSSRNMVNARSDSVTKNQVRSYKRYEKSDEQACRYA